MNEDAISILVPLAEIPCLYLLAILFKLFKYLKFRIKFPICSKTLPYYILAVGDEITIGNTVCVDKGFSERRGGYYIDKYSFSYGDCYASWAELEELATKVSCEFGVKWYRPTYPRVKFLTDKEHRELKKERWQRRVRTLKVILKAWK